MESEDLCNTTAQLANCSEYDCNNSSESENAGKCKVHALSSRVVELNDIAIAILLCIIFAVDIAVKDKCLNCSKGLLTIQEAFNMADFGKLIVLLPVT